MLPKALRLTVEDYLSFPEDGKRHEIIDGEHYMTPAPNVRHQEISKRLEMALIAFVEEKGLGKVFDAPIDVVFSEHDVVQPDIIYISKANSRIITEQNIQGSPDLIVEILSENSLKADKVVKKRTYARYGVKEYWIVDPTLNRVEVYRLGKEGYRLARTLEEKETLTSRLLPELKIDLKKILAKG